VNVIHVSFEQSSKAKAINRALAVVGEGYDSVVVLDADNIMAPGFLQAANDAFDRGFAAVQGHRTAKNLNTPFAILDAASEEINNHIFRKGHRVLGLSSALIGSGMAFDFTLFRDTMAGVTAHGEDKELEMHLLAAGIRIEYLPDALVYDEKIQSAGVFAKQRKRWLAAQFGIFRQYAPAGLKQLLTKGNLDLFDKVVQVMLPPRVLQIGLTTILLVAVGLLNLLPGGSDYTAVSLTLYAALWLVTAAALVLAFPRRLLNGATLRALKQLPGAFLVMFGLLFRLRGAGKNFIHTPHGTPHPGKS
jgi:cellulose synthase/poly-beta-1,6-N-acetylglucosamine synthase-like glycosyltransferase